jgi:hypothetical protein
MSQIMCEAMLAHVGDMPLDLAISDGSTNSFIDMVETANINVVEFDTDVYPGSLFPRRGDSTDVMRVKS